MSTLRQNQRAWDILAERYFGHSALPDWGPYGIGRNDRRLIGPISGKTFLEVGCGSGHSLRYLLHHGARHVYGLDFSRTQIRFAEQLNQKFLKTKKLTLFHQPMENKIKIPRVDTVFAIFSLGWSINIPQTLKLIHLYLKTGGRFVFSWEHAMFQHVEYNRQLVVTSSYFHESVKKGWKDTYDIQANFPTTASWFTYLQNAGFQIVQYLEPKPKLFDRQSLDPSHHFSKIKALAVPMAVVFECRK